MYTKNCIFIHSGMFISSSRVAMGCKSPTQMEVFAEIEHIKTMLRPKKNDAEMTY